MRSQVFYLVGVVSGNLANDFAHMIGIKSDEPTDCSNLSLFVGQREIANDVAIAGDGYTYKALWESGQPPKENVAGWQRQGKCEQDISTIIKSACEASAAFKDSFVYNVTTPVVFENVLWYNKWWINTSPMENPDVWVPMYDCVDYKPYVAPTAHSTLSLSGFKNLFSFGTGESTIGCDGLSLYLGEEIKSGNSVIGSDGSAYTAQVDLRGIKPPTRNDPRVWKSLGKCVGGIEEQVNKICQNTPRYVPNTGFSQPTTIYHDDTIYRNRAATPEAPGASDIWVPILHCSGASAPAAPTISSHIRQNAQTQPHRGGQSRGLAAAGPVVPPSLPSARGPAVPPSLPSARGPAVPPSFSSARGPAYAPSGLVAPGLRAAAPASGVDCTDFPLYLGQVCPAGTKVIASDRHAYESKWEGGAPKAGADSWTDLGLCTSDVDAKIAQVLAGTPDYIPGNTYATSQLVKYQSKIYINQWWTDAAPGVDASWLLVFDPNPASTVQPPSPSFTTKPVTAPAPTTKPVTAPVPTTKAFSTPRPTTTVTTKRTTTTTTTTTTTPTTTTKAALTTRATTKPTTPKATTQARTTTKLTTTTTTTPGSGSGHIRPDGPTGPNGECVWPEWDSKTPYSGIYVTLNNRVYYPSYYAEAGVQPPATPWQDKGECTGVAPHKLTDAEILALADPNNDELQVILDPWSPDLPTDEEVAAAEAAILSNPVIQLVSEAANLAVPSDVDAIVPGRAENPENVKRVERIFPQENWYKWFPLAADSYTYENWLRAVGLTPLYCQTYEDGRDSDLLCKKSLATSFAHFVQETSANWPSLVWSRDAKPDHYHPEAAAFYSEGTNLPLQYQALWYVREAGHTETEGNTGQYRECDFGNDSLLWALNYPCYDNAGYFGRGSKQISWNYNYGRFSDAVYGDAKVLLKDPSTCASTWLNFASATWFFVTPQSPKPSMQQVIDGTWVPNSADQAAGLTPGFGSTIQIINGGLECGQGNNKAALNRAAAYKAWMAEFGLEVDPSEDIDCQHSKPFPPNSAGAYTQYWTRDWSGSKCKAGNEQTPWIVASTGGYQACVDYFFRSHHVLKGKIVAHYGATSR